MILSSPQGHHFVLYFGGSFVVSQPFLLMKVPLFINQPVRSIGKVPLPPPVMSVFTPFGWSLTHLLQYDQSTMYTSNFPLKMWLICPMPCGSTFIVRMHLVSFVWYFQSHGLWFCPRGWQRFWLLYSIIHWLQSLCSRSCMSKTSLVPPYSY